MNNTTPQKFQNLTYSSVGAVFIHDMLYLYNNNLNAYSALQIVKSDTNRDANSDEVNA